MERYAVSTPHAPSSGGASSQAIAHNGVLYVSGQLPMDPVTGAMLPRPIVRGTEAAFRAQVLQCLANLRAVCEAAGGSLDEVVRVGIYLTDLSDFAAVNAVMQDYFAAPYPARSTIEVSGLPKGAAFEVDAVMVLD